MQQTLFRPQEPVGRPPNSEQAAPGTQIPSSSLKVVQLSNFEMTLGKSGFTVNGIHLLICENGLEFWIGLPLPTLLPNLLLKKPALRRLAVSLLNNRLSTSPSPTSSKTFVKLINEGYKHIQIWLTIGWMFPQRIGAGLLSVDDTPFELVAYWWDCMSFDFENTHKILRNYTWNTSTWIVDIIPRMSSKFVRIRRWKMLVVAVVSLADLQHQCDANN